MTEAPFITPEGDRPVVMVMTGAAFNAAERASVGQIEADLAAMADIATRAGTIAINRVEELPPQLIVVRDSMPDRKVISQWDTRVPIDSSSPGSERYFWATDLQDKRPRSSERTGLIAMANAIGATSLTEISIPTWMDAPNLARAYAAGLLFAQRPLDPVQTPRRLLASIVDEVGDTLSGRTNKKLRTLGEIDAASKTDTPIAPPFVFHYNVKDLLPKDE